MIKQKKLEVYHRSSFREVKIMGVSHGYRLKPLCQGLPTPIYVNKKENYWDKGWFHLSADRKCQKCETHFISGTPSRQAWNDEIYTLRYLKKKG